MSLHENTMDKPHVERSQADTTDNRRTYRLYPSLPNIDRYDVHVPEGSVGEKLHTAANSLLRDTQLQSEVPSASSDVRLKAQILILEEQRQELLSINEKWAKEYRTMRQYYKKKVQDLTSLLQQFEEEMSEEGDISLHKKAKDAEITRAGEGDVSSELLKAEKDAKELRALNSALTRKGQHQHEEIRRLNKALQEALQTSQPRDVSSETLQDLWKHQAEVYKEDFLKERRDREKLKEKYLDLEMKFRKVHSELRVFKLQEPRTCPPQAVLECTCTHRAKQSDWEVQPSDQHHVRQQRR